MQFDFMYAFTVSFYFSQVDQVVDPAFSLSQETPPYRNCQRGPWRRKGYFRGSPNGP